MSNITSIHDNTFNNVDTDFNLQNITTPVGFDLTATNNHTSGIVQRHRAWRRHRRHHQGLGRQRHPGRQRQQRYAHRRRGQRHHQGSAGTDTVDYSVDGGSGAVTVNLTTGTATDTFGNTDTLISIENAIGTSGADTFTSASTG